MSDLTLTLTVKLTLTLATLTLATLTPNPNSNPKIPMTDLQPASRQSVVLVELQLHDEEQGCARREWLALGLGLGLALALGLG